VSHDRAWRRLALALGLTVTVVAVDGCAQRADFTAGWQAPAVTPAGSGPSSVDASPSGSPAPSSASPAASPSGAGGAAAGAAPARFATLAPGAALPSGAQCATWVRARPYPENKGVNRRANQTTGHSIGTGFFQGDDPRANTRIAPRVDGNFTGTTREILRWAACKWGVDEDLVLAQAAIESWWRQDTHGDWTGDASRCAPGRGLGVDGKSGQCPESFGILQNRYPYEKSAWPGIGTSTAMNADLAYGIWRTCFEGYEGWLNTVDRGRDYAAGDAWGCVGRWLSGRWHVAAGDQYVGRVRGYLDQRIWETATFQQP
jgi:autotransporter family porin